MTRFPVIRLVLIAAVSLAVSGCDSTRRALGIGKSAPDEFAVMARAPLVVPPDFNLRPPAPGMGRPQEGAPSDQARRALYGSTGREYHEGGFTPGEARLLQHAGATEALPDIRERINREVTAFAREDGGFSSKLIFWSDDTLPGTPIDPVAESQRLRRNQAQGLPASDGPVPVISRSGSTSFLNLF